MEEDIIGLHVSVHDVVLVKDLEGLEELFEDEKCLRFCEFGLFG